MLTNKHISTLLVIAILINGCTHTVNMDKSEFEEVITQSDEYWKGEHPEKVFQGDYIFHLHSGEDISASRFVKRDSSFVILEIYDSGTNTAVDSITVPLSNIRSIEKIELWKGPTIVIVSALVLGLVGLIIYANSIPTS